MLLVFEFRFSCIHATFSTTPAALINFDVAFRVTQVETWPGIFPLDTI